jgi:hypothetical protein
MKHCEESATGVALIEPSFALATMVASGRRRPTKSFVAAEPMVTLWPRWHARDRRTLLASDLRGAPRATC